MKTKLISLLVFAIFASTYGQFGPQQIITTDALGARSVCATDIDGDGDMDVLSASAGDDKIGWYENDGVGNFGSQQIITTNALGARSVCATDIDGDDDMDVLSASYDDKKITWYENDGDGNFGSYQIITTSAESVYAEDLDGDGDMDVLSASSQTDDIFWYENENGDGSNWIGHVIPLTGTYWGGMSVYAEDLDGDGDMDVLYEGINGPIATSIAWFKNDGNGNFGPRQNIDALGGHVPSLYTTDIDGDGDMDVLSASQGVFGDINKISWYENDGDGNFGPQQIIISNEDAPSYSVCATDLDGDGDMDVLSASFDDDKIAWYENTDGLGNFGTEQIISIDAMAAYSVYAEDIDGDGDMDVLSASSADDKIAWYENLHSLGVDENTLLDISIFPNPVKDVLNILSQNDNPIHNVQIYDILGRLVLEEKDDFNQLDVSNLDSGVLFVKIQTTEGGATIKVIKE